jgi:hypothetical protein
MKNGPHIAPQLMNSEMMDVSVAASLRVPFLAALQVQVVWGVRRLSPLAYESVMPPIEQANAQCPVPCLAAALPFAGQSTLRIPWWVLSSPRSATDPAIHHAEESPSDEGPIVVSFRGEMIPALTPYF